MDKNKQLLSVLFSLRLMKRTRWTVTRADAMFEKRDFCLDMIIIMEALFVIYSFSQTADEGLNFTCNMSMTLG